MIFTHSACIAVHENPNVKHSIRFPDSAFCFCWPVASWAYAHSQTGMGKHSKGMGILSAFSTNHGCKQSFPSKTAGLSEDLCLFSNVSALKNNRQIFSWPDKGGVEEEKNGEVTEAFHMCGKKWSQARVWCRMSSIITLIKREFLSSPTPTQQAANHSYFTGSLFALLISYTQRWLLWSRQFTFGVFEE